MTRGTVTTIVASILGGAVIGGSASHVLHASSDPKPAAPESVPEMTRLTHVAPALTSVVARADATVITNTVTVVDQAAIDDLEAEIARLQAEYDRKQAEVAALQEQVAKATEARPRRESRREREERLKQEDPERYEQMQKERAAFRERMNTAVADRAQFLEELDTSAMSTEEKEGHDELLERIAQTWSLIESLQNGTATSGRETGRQLHEQFHVIRELYEVERNYVLRQVGTDLGFNDADAQEFSDYISDIYEMTSPRPTRGMGGSGGGRPAPVATP